MKPQNTPRREQVLVVDDDKVFRLATKTLLEDEHYSATTMTDGKEALNLSTITRDAEERYLRQTLRQSRGNILQVARLMEIDRKTVCREMTEYRINPGDFRE